MWVLIATCQLKNMEYSDSDRFFFGGVNGVNRDSLVSPARLSEIAAHLNQLCSYCLMVMGCQTGLDWLVGDLPRIIFHGPGSLCMALEPRYGPAFGSNHRMRDELMPESLGWIHLVGLSPAADLLCDFTKQHAGVKATWLLRWTVGGMNSHFLGFDPTFIGIGP